MPNSDSIIAPLWLGEFGTGNTSAPWWKYIRRYIGEQDLGWAYWAVDGLKNFPSFGVGEPFGIFRADYQKVSACMTCGPDCLPFCLVWLYPPQPRTITLA